MITAKWLLENHLSHLAMVQYLTVRLSAQAEQKNRLRDEEIQALALARPPLDGMPRSHSRSSPTERIALSCASISAPPEPDEPEAIAPLLSEYQHYVSLYEASMTGLTDHEKWLLHKHCVQKLPLSAILILPESPFGVCARTTLWRHKERALQKVNVFLNSCQKDGGEAAWPFRQSTTASLK